jgi:hypothetical protein
MVLVTLKDAGEPESNAPSVLSVLLRAAGETGHRDVSALIRRARRRIEAEEDRIRKFDESLRRIAPASERIRS